MAVANTLAYCVSPVACTIKFMVGSGLTKKYQTWLEKLPGTNTQDYYKHSFITAVKSFPDYSCKKVIV